MNEITSRPHAERPPKLRRHSGRRLKGKVIGLEDNVQSDACTRGSKLELTILGRVHLPMFSLPP
jgi:hypothetical protein